MNRREFTRRSAAAGAALALPGPAEVGAKGVGWPVGCFNRPWARWPFDRALTEVRAAGFTTLGLLTRTRDEPFAGPDATPAYLTRLKERVAASGLAANMAALRPLPPGPPGEAARDARRQVDNAHALGLKYVMTFGADDPKEFGPFVKAMAGAAAYAEGRGVGLVLKPHGGIIGSAADIRRALEAVGHRNFSVWYDPGNIVHYTGKDPVAELGPLAGHVTGFCAKDCAGAGGEVMVRLGSGKVDFAAVLRRLRAAGFKGPVMLEGCEVGKTPGETTAKARTGREFLEGILASL